MWLRKPAKWRHRRCFARLFRFLGFCMGGVCVFEWPLVISISAFLSGGVICAFYVIVEVLYFLAKLVQHCWVLCFLLLQSVNYSICLCLISSCMLLYNFVFQYMFCFFQFYFLLLDICYLWIYVNCNIILLVQFRFPNKIEVIFLIQYRTSTLRIFFWVPWICIAAAWGMAQWVVDVVD